MQRMTMPNLCINFLNKAAKSLPILYDFAVASLADAWIKIEYIIFSSDCFKKGTYIMRKEDGRIPRGCVD